MKGYDFLHLVLVVLTLRGFAQATYMSNIKKIVVGIFKKNFIFFFLLIKKLEIEKTKLTFVISVLKVVCYVGLVFSNSNFFINKISQGRNWFVV